MPITIPEPNADGDTWSDDDRSILLDLLFDHRAEVIRGFLRDHYKPTSGTKEQLRDRIAECVEAGEVSCDELLDLLDTVEGWGNQHVYLLKAPSASPVLQQFAKEASVRAILRRNNCEHLFNRRLRLVLPVNPQLASVEWNSTRVRFVWVERRVWRERRPDLDRHSNANGDRVVEDNVEFDAYQVFQGRGLVAFELDLVSGQAALLIQALPSGNDYGAVRGRFYEQLHPLLDVSGFTSVRVGRSITHLESLPGVRRRQIEHSTERGSRITYVSSERNVDAFADPSLNRARHAAGERVVGRLGNFYWRIQEDGHEIHVKVYAVDNRVGFFGECDESEVRHVLRSVRQHSR